MLCKYCTHAFSHVAEDHFNSLTDHSGHASIFKNLASDRHFQKFSVLCSEPLLSLNYIFKNIVSPFIFVLFCFSLKHSCGRAAGFHLYDAAYFPPQQATIFMLFTSWQWWNTMVGITLFILYTINQCAFALSLWSP